MSKGYLRQVSRYFLSVLIFALTSLNTHAAIKSEYKDSLWIAQKYDLVKFSTATGQSLFKIHTDYKVQSIAVDKKSALVWLVNEHELNAYNLKGEQLRGYSLSTILSVENISHKKYHHKKNKSLKVIVDKSDSSLWLYDKKQLWHVTDQGELIHRFSIKEKIEKITLVPSLKHAWIASKKSIYVFDIKSGQLIHHHKNSFKNKITDLAYDQTLNEIWLANKKAVFRLTPEGEQTYQKKLHHPEILQHDGKGNLWLATKTTLFYLDSSGAILFKLNRI